MLFSNTEFLKIFKKYFSVFSKKLTVRENKKKTVNIKVAPNQSNKLCTNFHANRRTFTVPAAKGWDEY